MSMMKIINVDGLHCKITSIPSRMIFVSAKEGQMQTWWENINIIFIYISYILKYISYILTYILKYISYILKYISLIHQLPGFFSEIVQQQDGQNFENCAKIDGQTTRTPVSSKIFGLASILVRATTSIINVNVVNKQFQCDRCQISSKARRMCNHPVFCNKVGIRVGYLAVLDLESTDHQATWRQSTNSGHVLNLEQKMCKTIFFQ